MPSTRSQRGQGTVEYVAIIALVALVLAAAVAGAAGLGAGIGNAVVGQIRHALCVVAEPRVRGAGRRAAVRHADGAR